MKKHIRVLNLIGIRVLDTLDPFPRMGAFLFGHSLCSLYQALVEHRISDFDEACDVRTH